MDAIHCIEFCTPPEVGKEEWQKVIYHVDLDKVVAVGGLTQASGGFSVELSSRDNPLNFYICTTTDDDRSYSELKHAHDALIQAWKCRKRYQDDQVEFGNKR